MMLLDNLRSKNLIHVPHWLPNATQYLCYMGSVAYGASNDMSDCDVYGFCIPPKDMVFPHLDGEIQGFGRQKKRFEQWQEHHINDPDNEKQYDFSVYGIVKFFQLCMDNNPNMVDALFVPRTCVMHSTQIGELVREEKNVFLHKGCWHKFKGYAYSQLHKMSTKNPEGSRKETIEKYGYDVKFGYHVVRLILECEQILAEHTLTLDRNAEILKAIRNGEWSMEKVIGFFNQKEHQLEDLYHQSTLPYKPDEEKIKALLVKCLEMYYNDLSDCIVNQDKYKIIVQRIKSIIEG